MRNAIKEYLELSDEAKKGIWNHAVFVFDTNVFLNLYRFSKRTRNTLIDSMERLSGRIWMPNHVAHEFMKDRVEVIFETVDRYTNLQKAVNQLQSNFIQSLRLKDTDKEYVAFQKDIERIQSWLNTHKENNVIVTEVSDDKILDKLLSLFDGKVGNPFSSDELEGIKKEAAERYKKKIPPGYKDAKKASPDDDNNIYGDLIVWEEIMNYASAQKVDIVFVTHDCKEDWWNIVHGKTVGPRIELRKEFLEKTGQQILMYNMDSFLRQSEVMQGREIDQSIVDEVQTMPQQKFFNNRIDYYSNDHLDEPSDILIQIKQRIIQINQLQEKNEKRSAALVKLKKKYKKNGQSPQIAKEIERTQDNYYRTEARIAHLERELSDMTGGSLL